MIRALAAIGGPDMRTDLRGFVWLAVLNGVTQALAMAALVPIVVALFRGDRAAVRGWLLVLLAGFAVNAVLVVWSTRRGFTTSMGVVAAMHERLSGHLVRMPLGWFDPSAVGRVSHLAVRGTLFVAQTAMDIVVPLVVNIAGPATVVVVALAVEWRVGLALVCAAPVIYASARFGAARNARAEAVVHAASVRTNARLLEFATHQVALRGGGVRGTEYRPLAEALDAHHRAGRRSLWSSVTGMIMQGCVVQTVFGVVVALAVWRALGGGDPVLMLAMIGLCAQFTGPLRILAELDTALRRSAHEVRDVQQILELPTLPEPVRSARLPAGSELEFDRVSFSYGDGPLLDGVDLRVRGGSLTALVGPSGSGKTTLTRLAARFYDPDAGEVRLGGVPLRELAEADRMQRLALVFQDVYLFDDTLAANIALGNPDATPAQIRRAAESARVTEIADRLPHGWQTRVGEGGRLLSGGERQRVSIARALVKRAPVLLLDEATAALDPTTAAAIHTVLDEIAEDTTVLVIAHQLSTIVRADTIAFLDDGRVVEQGTHAELLAAAGRYARFWDQRTQASTWTLTTPISPEGTPR